MLKKNIGKLLRSRRKELNLSSEEVVNELGTYGFKIMPKTLYNWENGIRQPNADTFLILCKIYKIKNSLQYFGFSSNIAANVTNNEFSKSEKELINKYRALDEQGKFFISTMLDAQLKSMEFGTKNKNNDKIS